MSRFNDSIKARAIIALVVVAFLFASAMFLNTGVFVEDAIISKWYALIAGAIICAIVMLFYKGRCFETDAISLALFLFVGYVLIRGAVSGVPVVKGLLFAAFILLYVFFRTNRVPVVAINAVIVLVCLSQAVYGILQASGLLATGTGFNISGSFDNPAGIAASLAAGFPFCFALGRTKALGYAGLAAAVVIAVAVAMSDSRAGMVAVIVVAGVYFLAKYKSRIRHFRIYAIVGVALLLVVGALLFLYKKDSSLGRVLIWNNSVEMMKDKPLAGHGAGSFMSDYMVYQADYFKDNPASEYAVLADNVSHPFSEYILIAVEYGVIGILILAIIVILVVRAGKKELSPYVLGLMSVAIFACFSYPMRYAFVIAVVSYCFANIRVGRIAVFRNNIVPKIIVSVIALFCMAGLAKDVCFEYRWGALALRSQYGEGYMNAYENLSKRWNGDAFFWYNYGALLNVSGDYDRSVEVMSRCERHLNDYDVQMMLGDGFAATGQWKMAEKHYMASHYMIPNRFMPYDRLMDLYCETGETEKAAMIAETVVGKQVKVPSSDVQAIVTKARGILEKNSGSANSSHPDVK